MNKKIKYSLLLIIIFFAISNVLVFGANTNCQVNFLKNKLAINAENVPLGVLLKVISEKTNVVFVVDKEESEKIISVKFQSLPIEKALERILNKLNQAMVYNFSGKIQMVKIVGKSSISSYISLPSRTMKIEPPIGEEMGITHSGEEMGITRSGEEMGITHFSKAMEIIPPSGKEMKIIHPSNAMVIELPNT